MVKIILSSGKDDIGSVYFEIATTSIFKSKSLPLSENKKVEMKATGKIIVYLCGDCRNRLSYSYALR